MAALTALAIGSAIAGIGLQAYGQHKAGQGAAAAGKAQQAAAESQAELDEFNAHVADQQAQDALERGGAQESKFRSQVRGLIGSQRAGQGASGVDVNYGSTVAVQADAAALGELDALTIRNNAMREQWGYQVEASDLRTKAEIARQTGEFAAEAGEAAGTTADFAAVGTLVGGAGSLLMQRYGFKSPVGRARVSTADPGYSAGNITGGFGMKGTGLPKATLIGG